ncbi:MAG: molybdate ABC transporter substrate-binding protein [Peptoniphilaceae bacterium]|nr:molybdate ABC transporter substrate-binding protein [Peptoniphilaceae bacterium]MDY6018748.1 molybdate ABC transporter substrate-binding protein [Anaerococcus sp.]
MNLKKTTIGLFTLAMVLNFAGCGSKEKDNSSTEKITPVSSTSQESTNTTSKEKKDIVVFAAASLTDVLDELKTAYEKENYGVNLTFNFDSSGTLKTQIEEGADVDLFISAAQKQMNELDPKNEEYGGKVGIDSNSRVDLLENKVCLVVSEGNKNNIEKFEDLNTDKVKTIALGNEDVPVGQYSEEILKNLGIFDAVKPKVTLGSNVREVASWVSENTVDAGIIYATDAKAFNLQVVAEADDSMLDNKVIYPAAVLENSKNKEDAQKFLDFLKTDKASEIFEKAGFTPIK